MTHKHHNEKHAKKRHFMNKDHIHSKERMASLQPTEKTVVDEKAEPVNPIVEKQSVVSAKQTSEVKPTSMADVVSAPPATTQPTIQFARKKNALEKLKDKFHQFIKLF